MFSSYYDERMTQKVVSKHTLQKTTYNCIKKRWTNCRKRTKPRNIILVTTIFILLTVIMATAVVNQLILW